MGSSFVLPGVFFFNNEEIISGLSFNRRIDVARFIFLINDSNL